MKSIVRHAALILTVVAMMIPSLASATPTGGNQGTHIQAYHQRVQAFTQRFHQAVAPYRQRYLQRRSDGVKQHYWHAIGAHMTTVRQTVASHMTTVRQRVRNGR